MMIAFSGKQEIKTPLVLAAFIFCCHFASCAYAAEDAPALHPQDSWTYRDTHEVNGAGRQSHIESTVIRADRSGILLSSKEVGSTMPAREVLWGADWSRSKSINGQETVVNKPLDFPLSTGKAWVVDYTEDHPNRQVKTQRTHLNYEVVGWEKITVPAGTFNALKIEGNGEWTAQLEPATTAGTIARTDEQGTTAIVSANKVLPKTATGRLYKAVWYSPEAKRFVKSVEENYSSGNALHGRDTSELESYKVAHDTPESQSGSGLSQ